MEGFMDVIRASTIGIKNTVALMGTAMTDDQLLEFYKGQFDNLANQIANDQHAFYLIRKQKWDEETADINRKIARIETTIASLKQKGNSIGDAKDVIDDGYNQQSYKEQILNNVEVLKDPSKGHDPSNVEKYNSVIARIFKSKEIIIR